MEEADETILEYKFTDVPLWEAAEKVLFNIPASRASTIFCRIVSTFARVLTAAGAALAVLFVCTVLIDLRPLPNAALVLAVLIAVSLLFLQSFAVRGIIRSSTMVSRGWGDTVRTTFGKETIEFAQERGKTRFGYDAIDKVFTTKNGLVIVTNSAGHAIPKSAIGGAEDVARLERLLQSRIEIT